MPVRVLRSIVCRRLFFLNYFSRSQVVCVDTFGGNVEHMRNPHFAALVPETERRFDANIAGFGARVEKIKGPSTDVLPQLGIASRRFDIVYVDGSHLPADVYSDGALAWPMVARAGIVIFDDYEFDEIKDESERTKRGIDAFLAAFEGNTASSTGLPGRDRQALGPLQPRGGWVRCPPSHSRVSFHVTCLNSPSPAGCVPAKTVYSGWCGLACSRGRARRPEGPAVTLDGQHRPGTPPQWYAVAQVRLGGAAPIVRIPVGEFATASRALDFGAEGIIAPMINTVADARAYVSFAKFPPIGERSWGPHRATTLGNMPDQKVYLREANALTVTFAMIETRTALDNVEAIAATPGIDALFLGPADLSIALSDGANVDPMAAEVDREIDRITAPPRRHHGAYCHSAERALALAKRGVRFLAVGSDMGFCAPVRRRR